MQGLMFESQTPQKKNDYLKCFLDCNKINQFYHYFFKILG